MTDRDGQRPVRLHDADETAALLPFDALTAQVARAALELEAGRIASPPRHGLPLAVGGVLLSMPAAAADIGVHKLVTVQPLNRAASLPTIHGLVTVCDGASGAPVCVLDGPVLTARRTAAVTLVAIEALLGTAPRRALLIGTGTQARVHAAGLRERWPDCSIAVRGSTAAKADAFCAEPSMRELGAAPAVEGDAADADVVVTLTTSRAPVYDEPARRGRLVVGVGAFRPDMVEIGARTLAGSTVVVDDPEGARHEAGDLLQAGVDWTRVRSLAAALRGEVVAERPFVFKSVGSAAWDLAACRVALATLRG